MSFNANKMNAFEASAAKLFHDGLFSVRMMSGKGDNTKSRPLSKKSAGNKKGAIRVIKLEIAPKFNPLVLGVPGVLVID